MRKQAALPLDGDPYAGLREDLEGVTWARAPAGEPDGPVCPDCQHSTRIHLVNRQIGRLTGAVLEGCMAVRGEHLCGCMRRRRGRGHKGASLELVRSSCDAPRDPLPNDDAPHHRNPPGRKTQ